MTHCKRFVLAAVLLCTAPISAFAGVGHIRLYADAGGNMCDFHAPAPLTLYNVYVVHRFDPGDDAAGIRFSVPTPPGWTYVSFYTSMVFIGTMPVDLAVGYGSCVTTAFLVGWGQYLAGPTGPCIPLPILAPQGFASPYAATCAFAEAPLASMGGIVNPTPACCCDCLATEQSTWGSVKALYR